jgi:hypothetical protein
MKKTILFVSTLIVSMSVTTGFVFSRLTQTMRARINAKDLQEYGLTVIKPSDPDFDRLASESLGGVPSDEIESLKPLSVFIKNTGNKIVVSYAIVWEGVEAGGKRKAFKMFSANSEALTDPQEFFDALPRTNLDATIRPGRTRLISLLPLPLSVRSGGAGGFGGRNQDGQQGSTDGGATELRQRSSELLARYTDLTVTIDGVFFDDGTFVGPDDTGFFDRMKAQVEAKLELRRGIAEKLGHGKSKDEIFKDIEAKAGANTNVQSLARISSPTDAYNFFSRFFAGQILTNRKAYGSERALEKALGPKNRPEIVLRKVK